MNEGRFIVDFEEDATAVALDMMHNSDPYNVATENPRIMTGGSKVPRETIIHGLADLLGDKEQQIPHVHRLTDIVPAIGNSDNRAMTYNFIVDNDIANFDKNCLRQMRIWEDPA